MKNAFLFPGQGAQVVGMGKDFYDHFPAARTVFEHASEAIAVDLMKVCFHGPQEELNKTDICQPAILVTSLAMIEAIKVEAKRSTLECAAAAGLSLGEYTALAFAGAISLVDAVRLVRARGRFMMEACLQYPSSMASVMGLTREECEAVCAQARDAGIINVANINSEKQIVISGELKALEKASELAKARGARKVVPLAVSGAFHSLCMAPAGERLGLQIDQTQFNIPCCPVIQNVTGAAETGVAKLRQALKTQLTGSVEWVKSMQTLGASGVRRAVEVGPGRVLTGLLKSAPGVEGVNINSVETMQQALAGGVFAA